LGAVGHKHVSGLTGDKEFWHISKLFVVILGGFPCWERSISVLLVIWLVVYCMVLTISRSHLLN
jgi:hypothetical protein